MSEAIYSVDKTCPVCEKAFPVTRVRSRLILNKQDSDFCSYYKDINPYYYTVWVCPHCGYAAQDSEFEGISSKGIELMKRFLASRAVNIDFGGTRTAEQAIVTYKLAIFYGEMIGMAASKVGGLYLRLAWLYREIAQAEEETAAMLKAAEFYEQALSKERLPIGGMSEVTITYLIGELLRRSGQNGKSLLYFNQVVSNPQAKLEKRVMDLAREAWHQAREDDKKEKEAQKPAEPTTEA